MMNLAPFIDHTLLRFDATIEEFDTLCRDAVKYGFASVCVPPCVVKNINEKFKNQNLKIGSVIGFPCGYSSLKTKLSETSELILNGVDELDFMINQVYLHSGLYTEVEEELDILIARCRESDVKSKIIIEIGSLSDYQLSRICEIINRLHPDYTKTSTGMLKNGYVVNTNDIVILRSKLEKHIKIKASGGIRTKEQVIDLIHFGAQRVGTSSALQIIQ